MINKTGSIPYLQYGEVYTDAISKFIKEELGANKLLEITNTSINFFYQATNDVYLRVVKGVILLVVTKDIKNGKYEEFAIHRTVKINKGVYYNFIAVSEDCELEYAALPSTVIKSCITETPYKYKPLEPEFYVTELLSYYYSIRPADYTFPGETSEYWELTFVDNGTLNTKINEKEYEINNYDIVLYGPGQFHDQMTTNNHTCSYLTILFTMDIKHPELFTNQIFHADRDIAKVINLFIRTTKDEADYAKDLLICYLTEVLVRLIKQETDIENHIPIKQDTSSPMQQQIENQLLDEILVYISENIYQPLSVEDLCYQFSLSRSSLQALFKNYLDIAPKQYISNLKLKKSKELIKENKYTISQISSMLGFTSIHYFSRKFKAHYGINPTDYAKTIYN